MDGEPIQRNVRRNVHGVLLFDKPFGLSSNQALQKVKRIYSALKAGHTGSLDPIATGVLPIVFGEATKFSQHLLDADKKYLVTGKLGVRTTSLDSEGEVIATKSVKVTKQQLDAIISQFIGNILQIPPMYSALKSQGRPLYQLARQGISIEREARPVTIFSMAIKNFENDTLTLEVHCSKGTYIRTLIDDIGHVLGCGAHVIALRRQAVAQFTEAQAVTLDQLQQVTEQKLLDNYLLPVDVLIQNLAYLTLDGNEAQALRQGKSLVIIEAHCSGLVRIYHDQKFLGVAELENNVLQPKRLIAEEKE